MTHREIDQGIKERDWEIFFRGYGGDLKKEVEILKDELYRIEGEATLRVCRRARCTFELGHVALQQTEWNEDQAVFLLMRARHQRVA